MMTHVITTYGGGELFVLIFQGIAALFKADETGFVMPLMRIGLIVGSVYVLLLMFLRQSLQEGAKWFFWVVVATNLLFLPKATVFIKDPLTKMEQKVDNVPFALGAFASFVSTMGRGITEKFEEVFTLPNDFLYHKTGTVFASSLMSQLGQFRVVDPTFKGNMERFVNQCVVYDAMIGNKYTLTELQNAPNIWEFVRAKASPLFGFMYKVDKAPGTIVTCKAGAEALHKLWDAEIKRAIAIYGSRVQDRKLTETAFKTHLQGGAEFLFESNKIANNATDILRQEMMINAIEESSNNKLSELGAAHNYAATKALLQQRSTYAVAGEIAAKTLPLFKNVIEALSYALFIFIVVLALLPNGYKVLLTYCGILMWTQLWAPLYAVLNLIMTLYGKAETMGHGSAEGLTLLNSSAIINANADMVTLAAWLSVSIPFISYSILKQGAAAFVGLAQHLGSAMQSASSGAAAETVSGNISLGNVSMGNQAYQNTSAFQHNTSPSYSASQFKAMGASGVERNTFADGTQAFNDQAMSKLSVQIMGTENTSYATQESLNDARSVAETKSVAASNATEASIQTSSNFLSHVNKALSSGTDTSQTINASEAKSLQNFNNYVEDIRQSNNLTNTQAREVAIAAQLGIDFQGSGASIRGSFSDAKAFQDAVESAKNIATQNNYSGSLDSVLSAAQSFSEKQDEGRLAELGTAATASLNQASNLRNESSIAQNQVKTLSKDVSSGYSQSLAINKELTQEVLGFIAHQPANSGPDGTSGGQIGYDRARHIIEKGGEERAAYLTQFQKENPQYAIQEIRYGQEKEALNHQYDTSASHIQNQANLDQKNSQNMQNVFKQGYDMGLTLNTAPIPALKHPEPHKLREPGEQKPEAQQQKPQQPTGTSLQGPEKSSPFNEQVNSFFQKVNSEIERGRENISQKKAELQKIEKQLQKTPPKGEAEMTELHWD